MKRIALILILLVGGVFAQARPAAAANQRFIVRTVSLPLLQKACLLNLCSVVQTLDGQINQLFLVEFPSALPTNLLMNVLRIVPGVQDVEADLLQNLGLHPVPPSGMAPGLSDRTPMPFYGSTVWHGYAMQPALTTIRLPEARTWFHVTGAAVVADIDTGVDPNHPVLASSLLIGYDFTTNQVGGSEMTGMPAAAESDCSQCTQADINQYRATPTKGSTGSVLDSPGDDGFGHGTMVMGLIHLVAPTARLMPLKAFSNDGTGYTSDIIRAVYYAVQNKANVINMSFDFTTPSTEFADAIQYATQNGVIAVASAGNEGSQAVVYPAGISGVIGVASVNNSGQLSSFSNYGSQVVWVAAPGENVVSTFPYGSYASGSGTSFSSPLVAGTVALILNIEQQASPKAAAAAIANADPSDPKLGHGLLDVYLALQAAQYSH
jgi:hypothetical protein